MKTLTRLRAQNSFKRAPQFKDLSEIDFIIKVGNDAINCTPTEKYIKSYFCYKTGITSIAFLTQSEMGSYFSFHFQIDKDWNMKPEAMLETLSLDPEHINKHKTYLIDSYIPNSLHYNKGLTTPIGNGNICYLGTIVCLIGAKMTFISKDTASYKIEVVMVKKQPKLNQNH